MSGPPHITEAECHAREVKRMAERNAELGLADFHNRRQAELAAAADPVTMELLGPPPPLPPRPPTEGSLALGLHVRYVTDALADPPPEPPVIVEGMLRIGELCVIAAPRALGKSLFAGNLAYLLGTGEGYLGGALKIARPARCLICHGEVDEWESARRWSLMTGTGAAPDGVAESFDRWRLRTVRRRTTSTGGDNGDRQTDTDEWIDALLDPRLEETIRAHGFEVLIVDPWAVYFAGNENSNDETEAALDKLRDLAMRLGVAVVLIHHLSKATDAREPEDLWRGASRLADWASTRVTILPHWTERQAAEQGMTREQARRYVDVKFLRRSTPTPDFSMRLSEEGWWERWVPPNGPADSRRVHLEVSDVVNACRSAGGSWPSTTQAAADLGVATHTAQKLLEASQRQGALEPFAGPRGARGWRIPGRHLSIVREEDLTND